MKRGLSGRYVITSRVGGEQVRAFVPSPLPPEPPVSIDGPLREILDSALLALGRLDSIATLLPDVTVFLYMYVRKEAVLSSQIEGTQSSLSDLLLFETEEVPGVPLDDVVEVSSYVAALEHGLRRIHEGFPVSNRLFREMHAILLARGRGSEKSPGEFRTSQNWIGGSRPGNALFVPPPPDLVGECMGALEKWLHDVPERTPTLLKSAIAHVQFETIHPFLDGNGRLGRLMITLLLCSEKILHAPLLYLSLYFKQHRTEYYELLTRVRATGEWEAWIAFFAAGVRETATEAATTARQLSDLARVDREKINAMGRVASSAHRLHEQLQRRPLTNVSTLADRTGLSFAVVNSTLAKLAAAEIVRETTGRRRGRVFSYQSYLDILSRGTDPLPR